MSKAWKGGSTAAWRRTRAAVLARDGHRCRIQLPGCTTIATHVHHTVGRSVSGDDPAHLISACRYCNLKTGDPRSEDPEPRSSTYW